MQTNTGLRVDLHIQPSHLTRSELEDCLARVAHASPYWAHTGCCGNCSQGRLDCDCELDASMWQPERSNPWLIALYAVIATAAIAASALWPWGFA